MRKNNAGVKKSIKTPEIMYQHFEHYKVWVSNNPFRKMVFTGKNGDTNWEERERCLTFEGFCNYLETNNIMVDPTHYFINYQERYSEFVTICARIKREIRGNQIEGAMSNIFNPSITQRLNNLVERAETTIVEQPLFGPEENN